MKLVVVRYGARQYEPTCKFIHVYISSLHTSLLTFASNRCRFIMFVHVPKVHIARPCIEQFHILGPTQDLTQVQRFHAARTALARPADAHGRTAGRTQPIGGAKDHPAPNTHVPHCRLCTHGSTHEPDARQHTKAAQFAHRPPRTWAARHG